MGDSPQQPVQPQVAPADAPPPGTQNVANSQPQASATDVHQAIPPAPQGTPVQQPQRPQAATNQVLSQALLSDQQPIQIQYGTGRKEQELGGQEQAWELPAGVQSVEHEKRPEIPPEVEEYMTEVQDDQAQLPDEVVVADGQMPTVQPHYVAKPVIVLPMTKEEIEKGLKSPKTHSYRWLSEWAHKIWKMFSGEVVYQDDPLLNQK